MGYIVFNFLTSVFSVQNGHNEHGQSVMVKGRDCYAVKAYFIAYMFIYIFR